MEKLDGETENEIELILTNKLNTIKNVAALNKFLSQVTTG